MQVRLAWVASLVLLVSACAQMSSALGRDEGNAAQQTQEHPTDSALAGLDIVEGGYARFERASLRCDYRGCDNFPGRWFADSETPVYAEPRISAPVIDRLTVSEWVNAVRYEQHIQPRRGIVTRGGGGLEVGETLYLLGAEYDDEGGATMQLWRGGGLIVLYDGDEDYPEIRYDDAGAESIDWVYIEREDGRRNGWLRNPMMPGVEDRIDECPALDVSVPCRNLRSRTAPVSVSYPTPQPFRDCADCPSMVWIPGLSIAISQHEVTIGQWNACITDGGCPSSGSLLEGDARHPMVGISGGVDVYLEWLSVRTGHRYRWLTPEEWTEAAFPGGRQQNYYWGNEEPVCTRGARNGVAYGVCGLNGPLPVGSFQPNAYGLYDVLGNVSELVLVDSQSMRFLGGSWRSSEAALGGAVDQFSEARDEGGFRVARER